MPDTAPVALPEKLPLPGNETAQDPEVSFGEEFVDVDLPERETALHEEPHAPEVSLNETESVDVGMHQEELEQRESVGAESPEERIERMSQKTLQTMDGIFAEEAEVLLVNVTAFPELKEKMDRLKNGVGSFAKKWITFDHAYAALGAATAVGLTAAFPEIALPVMGVSGTALFGGSFFSELQKKRGQKTSPDSSIPGVNRSVELASRLLDGFQRMREDLYGRAVDLVIERREALEEQRRELREKRDVIGRARMESLVAEGTLSQEKLTEFSQEVDLGNALGIVWEGTLDSSHESPEIDKAALEKAQNTEPLRDLEIEPGLERQESGETVEQELEAFGGEMALLEEVILEIKQAFARGEDATESMAKFEAQTGVEYAYDFQLGAWMMEEMQEIVGDDVTAEQMAIVTAAKVQAIEENEDAYPLLRAERATAASTMMQGNRNASPLDIDAGAVIDGDAPAENDTESLPVAA